MDRAAGGSEPSSFASKCPPQPWAGRERTEKQRDGRKALNGVQRVAEREPLASGKPHPILPAGAASNDARDVRDERAKDVTARRDGHLFAHRLDCTE